MDEGCSKDSVYGAARRLARAGKLKEAILRCEPLAAKGHAECRCLIGWIYSTGGCGIEQNLDAAKKWLGPIASMGHPGAAYLLGTVHFQLREYDQALKWLNAAADRGHAGADYQLFKLHRNGFGVERDVRRAHYYLVRAADQGHVFAQRDIAVSNYHRAMGLAAKMKAAIALVTAMLRGIRTAVTEPYSDKTYD